MVSVDGNVEDLRLAIVSEARAEAEELKKAAQSRADAVRQRGQADAKAARESIVAQARQEAERLRSQVVATARLKSRSIELAQREKLLDRVFAAVAKELAAIGEREEYREIAQRLLREALAQLHVEKAEVLADRVTQGVLDRKTLDSVASDLKIDLTMGPGLEHGHGVIVQTPDGHLNFDNTLETRLARMQGPLRADVFRLLTGEGA
ncbi:MAG: V-type ATP synthase subunit E [Anaerolineales bacterium]|jgi:vacuolar-type H+-ATPase subunit E/Vma4